MSENTISNPVNTTPAIDALIAGVTPEETVVTTTDTAENNEAVEPVETVEPTEAVETVEAIPTQPAKKPAQPRKPKFKLGDSVTGKVWKKVENRDPKKEGQPVGILVKLGKEALMLHVSKLAGSSPSERDARFSALKDGDSITAEVIAGHGSYEFGLSEQALLRRTAESVLVKGAILVGTVKNPAIGKSREDGEEFCYGVFCALATLDGQELQGFDGLLHVSELDGKHPDERDERLSQLQTGDRLEVAIIKEPEEKPRGGLRISLSEKAVSRLKREAEEKAKRAAEEARQAEKDAKRSEELAVAREHAEANKGLVKPGQQYMARVIRTEEDGLVVGLGALEHQTEGEEAVSLDLAGGLEAKLPLGNLVDKHGRQVNNIKSLNRPGNAMRVVVETVSEDGTVTVTRRGVKG